MQDLGRVLWLALGVLLGVGGTVLWLGGTKPAYAGNIDSMTTCSWDRLGTVRKGEVLSIDAFYDPPEPQSDVMGIVLAYVYETDDLTGGTPAPAEGPAPAWPPPGGVPSGHSHQH